MGEDMEQVLFQDDVKYDLWLKIILVGSVVLLIALGFMFVVDFTSKDILPETPEGDSRIGAIVMFASAAFVCLIFIVVLPKKLFICSERIRIRFGLFFYNIPFQRIESYSKVRGIPMGFYLSSMTSYNNQIEIVRKSGLKLRFSPSQVDLFLEALNRAIQDWEKTQKNVARFS